MILKTFCAISSIFFLGLTLVYGVNSITQQSLMTGEIIVVQNKSAVSAYLADRNIVKDMVKNGLIKLTNTKDIKEAFAKIASTNEVVGIKVFSSPGPFSGTRPAVVAALISLMIESGFSPKNIIIWDKYLSDLQMSGYEKLANELGVRIAGAVQSGYDESVYYDKPLIGNLIYGDLEFGKKGEGIGRKSYISKLLTKEVKKIISIAPLLNHTIAGVCGHLFSITIGGVDNTFRFESSPERLNESVPEIFALPIFSDRTMLFITDALICQYEGGPESKLHYSIVPGKLMFSRDPVALDTISLIELNNQRIIGGFKSTKPNFEMFNNASLLELGISDTNKIRAITINLQH